MEINEKEVIEKLDIMREELGLKNRTNKNEHKIYNAIDSGKPEQSNSKR